MAGERVLLDISTSSDLSRVAEEVAETGVAVLLVRGDEPVAVVQPLPASERPSRRRKRAEPADDPLLGIIGMLDAGEPTSIALHKDRYIAEAVDRRRE